MALQSANCKLQTLNESKDKEIKECVLKFAFEILNSSKEIKRLKSLTSY